MELYTLRQFWCGLYIHYKAKKERKNRGSQMCHNNLPFYARYIAPSWDVYFLFWYHLHAATNIACKCQKYKIAREMF
jgi:hypothetical protein